MGIEKTETTLITDDANFPLVSIIVITYNSSKFVLETLESAKAQTYQNIELIVSDDCSQDNTVEICRDWIEENKARFVRTELITVPENTGIPANCNRGVRASKGEWIKLIAGDDILYIDAIENNIKFVLESSCKFVVSDLLFFNEFGVLTGYGSPKELKNFFSKKNVSKKYKSYLRSSVFLNVPTFFYEKSVVKKNDGFDEDIKLLEDIPFVLRTLKNNIDICYLDKKTVKYRVHKKSITGEGGSTVRLDFEKTYEKYKKNELCSGTIVDKFYNLIILYEYKMKKMGLGRSLFFKVSRKITSILRQHS